MADYINLLVLIDAVFVQEVLMEDKLAASPKKARKVMFTDPLIFHAIKAWLQPEKDPYNKQVKPMMLNPE